MGVKLDCLLHLNGKNFGVIPAVVHVRVFYIPNAAVTHLRFKISALFLLTLEQDFVQHDTRITNCAFYQE